MAGRPPLPIGTAGAVRYYQTDSGWRARTLFRDYDGATRPLLRAGRTKAEAGRRLKEAIRDRVHLGGGAGLTADSPMLAVAERWIAELKAAGKAPRTIEQYEYNIERNLEPGIGELRVREMTTGLANRYLRAVEAKRGAATAKMSRSVLSGVCGLACRLDILATNPVREVGKISTKPKRPATALDVSTVRDLRIWLTYDDKAIARDLPDLIHFLLGTGARIGEAIAGQWRDLDLDAGTIAIVANIVRVKGVGLIRQVDESSKLTVRRLDAPEGLIAMLRARRERIRHGDDDPVFPAVRGGWRDPSNTGADLRDFLKWAGFEGLTSHLIGRKTVASRFDATGQSARAAADQLGHTRPSMTQDRYYGRRAETNAATVLAAFFEEIS
jgi:integrase